MILLNARFQPTLSAKMIYPGKFRALLATARVANVPSVVSNVWVGVALGKLTTGSSAPWMLPWAILATSGVLLYAGGNFFNDWMDRDWDQSRRPERALPRGLFSAGLYLLIAAGFLTGGVAFAALVNQRCAIIALLLAACIMIYTIWHKRSPWTIIAMGMCRGLLPVMGFFAFQIYIDAVWPFALGLIFYIMGLSLTARQESMPNPPLSSGILARCLLLGAAVAVAWGNVGFYFGRWPIVAGVLPYLIWTHFCLKVWRRPVSKLVSGLLAGIPWVDWMVLLPMSYVILQQTTDDRYGFGILCVAAPPLAFFSALLLQKVAPAT